MPTPPDDVDLKQLLNLARNRSARSRRTLLENMTDLFLSRKGRLVDRERALMGDILTRLVHEVEMSVRRELAKRLASVAEAPRDLMVALANDEIEIALPILKESKVLSDADLIEIVKYRTREHRLAIAVRKELSEHVTDALVGYGETDVIVTLLDNHDAALSQRAMDYLASESRRIDEFQRPLLHRPDLPPELGARMFWWVSAALREYILNHFTIDEIDLDLAINDATSALRDAMHDEASTYDKAGLLACDVYGRGQLDEQFIVQALRHGHVEAFFAAFASLAEVDRLLVQRIFFDAGPEGLVVLCKGAGLSRSAFSTIFLLSQRERGGMRVTDPETLCRVLRIYDSLSVINAAKILRYWQLSPDYVATVEKITSRKAGAGCL